ncbi:MAG: hypothetical protein Q9208_005405 [Pyrenodesmia sp. 3 TL-2023]
MPTKARPKSMLSFTHRKSSSSSHVKVGDLTETTQEKASHRVTSKADPTKAINEAQPNAVAQALEQSTLESIRAIPHRDRYGNLISALCVTENFMLDEVDPLSADPDRSNPTRPRLERPLDTIRAFEAAIDGSYERRSPSRADISDNLGGVNKRNSYYQGQRPQQRSVGDSPGGYYNNRVSVGRPDSYIENYGGNPNQLGNGRRINQRVNSDPAPYGANNHTVYPAHGYHQDYDTVASASGNESHNTDPWGNSTDPSSENSSIDRVQVPKPDHADTHGFNGFGGPPHFQGPILEENGINGPAYGQAGYGQAPKPISGSPSHIRNGFAPAPPPHIASPRAPIKLGPPPATDMPMPNASGEKRRSWLKRRFSKA